MKVNLYAIHDAGAKAYMPPFPMQNDNLAIRSFQQAVQTQEHIQQHPIDYSMFRIGVYDDETAILSPEAPPELICTAIQTITMRENELRDIKLVTGETPDEVSNDSEPEIRTTTES